MPFIVGQGNGIGSPGAFILGGVILTFFAIPFAAMSRRITNAGAFYSYISAGFGRPAGTAAGWVALFTYNVLMLVPVAYAGYFGSYVCQAELGMDVPWQIFSFGVLLFVWLIGIRGIEVNTILMATFLVAEVAILVLTIIGVFSKTGFGSVTTSFAPSEVLSGNVGLALTFALLSFIGFEATAVFGEESRDPRRTVARATFAAVWVIAGLYALTTWAAVAAYPSGDVVNIAQTSPETFLSGAAVFGLGAWSGHVLNWLLLVSIVACSIAVHNMASRYIYAFGRDGLLPNVLGQTHPTYLTPHFAGTVQMLLMLAAVGTCAVFGADPYATLAGLSGSFATLGAILLMTVTSLAAIWFLKDSGESLWVRLIAPALAFLGLATAMCLILFNFGILAGESVLANVLPWTFIPIAVLGFLHGRKTFGRKVVNNQELLPTVDRLK
jgi:amino acid transporter